MIGLIVRPLMPPAALMWLTKRSMAFTCSLYSTSPAKPNWPERALRFATGNSTLMPRAVTPRALMLASLTGLIAEEVAASAGTTATHSPISVTVAAPSERIDLTLERIS